MDKQLVEVMQRYQKEYSAVNSGPLDVAKRIVVRDSAVLFFYNSVRVFDVCKMEDGISMSFLGEELREPVPRHLDRLIVQADILLLYEGELRHWIMRTALKAIAEFGHEDLILGR